MTEIAKNTKIKTAFLVIMAITGLMVLTPSFNQVSASNHDTVPDDHCDDEATFFFGLPTWYKYLERDGNCEIQAPGGLLQPAIIGGILLAVFEILLRLAGLVAVGFVIAGGVQYSMSQGAPDKVQNAKNTVVNALVGLVITLLSVVILNIVARGLI